MSSYSTLLVEDRGPVRILTLNQPQIFNPLDVTSGPELISALEQAELDPGIAALVLTGAGKAFSGGGNVRQMHKHLEAGQSMRGYFFELVAILHRSIITLRRLGKPVVCALNGVAAGGGLGWALACDLVVASAKARFDPGYIRIALNPDGGSSVFITRLIGHKRASQFFLTGKAIKAPEALAWGMVNEVVEPGEELERALKLAGRLAQGPAQALAATKQLLNQAAWGDLETLLEEERQALCRLADQPHYAEGIRAFMEKRPPRFV